MWGLVRSGALFHLIWHGTSVIKRLKSIKLLQHFQNGHSKLLCLLKKLQSSMHLSSYCWPFNSLRLQKNVETTSVNISRNNPRDACYLQLAKASSKIRAVSSSLTRIPEALWVILLGCPTIFALLGKSLQNYLYVLISSPCIFWNYYKPLLRCEELFRLKWPTKSRHYVDIADETTI